MVAYLHTHSHSPQLLAVVSRDSNKFFAHWFGNGVCPKLGPRGAGTPKALEMAARSARLQQGAQYGYVGTYMWRREVKGGVAHFMCVKGRDSIIAQDVEERKPANQPANQIPKKEKLMMLAILDANEIFN